MGNGQVCLNQKTEVRKPCLRAAISRTLAGHMPDDEDIITAYEKSLTTAWAQVYAFYKDGCVVKSTCPETGSQTTLRPHGTQDLCDLVIFETLGEGRQIHLLHPCGKEEPVKLEF